MARPTSGSSLRNRILAATLACAEDKGLSGFALEDVAVHAGVARASIYRHFPGGRAQLIEDTIAWEVARFWAQLVEAVADADGLAEVLERGLSEAHRAIEGHELLQRMLANEPGELLSSLLASEPVLHDVVRDYLRALLDREVLVCGVDADDAADYLARMFQTCMSSPGRWDLDDPEQVRRLVATEFLAGVLAPDGP